MNKLEAAVSNEKTTIPNILTAQINELPLLSFSQVSQLKKDLEDELSKQFDNLAAQNADMNTQLTTAEGYPRHDLDLVTIRLLKRNVNVLRNDLKRIIERIEYLLPLEFESLNKQNVAEKNLQNLKVEDTREAVVDAQIPFAKVVDVKLSSPSHGAGLQSEDLIIQFGSIHALNHNNLHNIGKLVQDKLNQEIVLKIKRNNDTITIQLKPRPWQGPGLLGCRIVQI
ncbi:unnamed protein product [Kluyveromyces dobzhanskii CBS 2104]|uniref:Probable 26S proteasome regulatory subunit p27 n=1 Tax=Kluyveromyces dobzhanskii CBS 2104 TaxID=1427455 RepID=A0A0A8L4T7_9SACH|nr:unnamed protein product [Kluyveromyces dobzhanskii CBS 2104]